MTTTGKVITWTSVIAVLALAGFIFFKFCFVYAEGVNEGDINYFQKEGFIFKTYEGKMIQTGLKNSKVQGSIQSNEFKFSVLPWRGNSQFIVDSVYTATPIQPVQPVKR